MSSGNLADAADAAVQSAVGSLDMPDGSSAGVVSLRRPLVERLRMTAAAMDAVAHAEVTSLAASAVFDGTDGGGGAGGAGGGGGLGGSSTPFGHALGPRSASEAASELRDLILAVQDLTAERDEAQKLLEKLRAEVSGEGGGLSELDTLREENAALRAENANMFTLKDENEALRTQVETLRLQLECARGATDDEEWRGEGEEGESG